MSRIARIIAPGSPHHVTQRGNCRQETFFSKEDYQAYLNLMSMWCSRLDVEVWAYCLMPNHVHMIAVPQTEDGLRRAIGEASHLSETYFQMKEERVFFDCGDIKLEGILTLAKNHSSAPGVVVCHPHPQYGGNMHNNLVTGITHTLSRHGFITFRFNFRGVGDSEGAYGGGVEEVKDVKGAIDFLSGLDPLETNSIFLVGYSFGAMVGLQVADKDDRIRGWVGISPPVAMYDFSFLKGSFKPKLLLFGDSDFACPREEMEKLFGSLEEPKSMSLIPGADHFFWGKEETVAEHALNFLSTFNKR